MKKSFILSGLAINKGQWNSNFEGLARRDANGNVFATDKARKYTIRKELELNGNKVLIKKHHNTDEGISSVKSLKNILGYYNCKKNEDVKKLYKEFIDLRIFGFILNAGKVNVNAHGSFQIYLANDIKKEYTEELFLDITSYKPSKDIDAKATIGNQVLIDEGYLNYTICIQPNIYFKEAERILGKDYNEKEVKKQFELDKIEFIKAINNDVTNTNSCTKNGVENFYNIVIDMKDSNKSLDKLNLEKIEVESKDKVQVDFKNTLDVIIHNKENIENVSLYTYNNENVEFINFKESLLKEKVVFIEKDMLLDN